MNKLKLITVFSAILKLSFSQSLITLSNSNMPGSGDTLRYSNAQLSSVGNYTQTGANFIWNFSTLVSTSQGIRNFKNALQCPYPFYFYGINEYGEKIADTIKLGPITLTNYYNYYKKQTSPLNAYVVDGAGVTINGAPVPSYYSNKDELYVFPLSYPKYDSTTFRFSTPTSTAIPFTYSKTGYRITNVDGWGTVTTPFGTANCLRLVTTQYSNDTIKNSSLPFPIGFPNYQRSYQWLTTTTKIPFLEISGPVNGTNFTPNQARYRDNYLITAGVKEEQNNIDIQLYPNPVKDKLYFKTVFKATVLAELYSVTGQIIKKQIINELNFIDVSSLETGVYVVKIVEDEKWIYVKFIKE